RGRTAPALPHPRCSPEVRPRRVSLCRRRRRTRTEAGPRAHRALSPHRGAPQDRAPVARRGGRREPWWASSGGRSGLIAKCVRELRGGAAQYRRELSAALPRETAGRCGYRERGDRRAGGHVFPALPYDRDRDAADALVVLLVIQRITLLTHLIECPAQSRAIDDRPRGVPAQIQALEQGVAASRRQVGEECLSGAGRVE